MPATAYALTITGGLWAIADDVNVVMQRPGVTLMERKQAREERLHLKF